MSPLKWNPLRVVQKFLVKDAEASQIINILICKIQILLRIQ